jgi:hypothetical protein
MYKIKLQGKGKVFLAHAMEAYGEMEDMCSFILPLRVDRIVAIFTLWMPYPCRNSHRYDI